MTQVHFLIVSMLLVVAPFARAELTEDCGEKSTPAISYKYCITKFTKSSSDEVLVLLHGGGGDEHEWKDYYLPISQAWDAEGTDAPIIITVSFGDLWLLVEANSAPQSGRLNLFRDQILPELELKALGHTPKRRLLAGASMGGFNAVQVLSHFPPGSFARAAILCPAVIDISPWASENEREAFVRKLGFAEGDVPKAIGTIDGLSQIVKSHVSDESTYQTSIAPLKLAESTGSQWPKTLIATNEGDRFFLQGGEALKISAQKGGARLETKLWEGKHCHVDYQVLTKFLNLN